VLIVLLDDAVRRTMPCWRRRLWRVFYSVSTLPLGAITLSRFRKADRDEGLEMPLARPGQ
jgi:hypothetical protein